jgi:putative ATP-dependent endonuclease of the OLD family
MYISEMSIRNFRNFRHVRFSFGPGVNALIGANGSGKSNAFHALRLLIDNSLPISSRSLRKGDFNRTLADYRGHWIVISLTLRDLGTSDPLLSLAHGVSTDGSVGRLTLYFQPNAELIQDYCSAATDGERQLVLERMTADQYRWTIRGGGSADPTDDQAYSELTSYLVNPAGGWNLDQAKFGTPYRHGELAQEVSCTFFNAVRDIDRPGRNQRSPLQEILSRVPVSPATKGSVEAAASTLNQELNAAPEISTESHSLGRTLRSAAGDHFAPAVAIEAVPAEFEDLWAGLQLFGREDGITDSQPVTSLGLGAMNLIYMGLKLRSYELLAASGKTANFLMVEEPEAHLHPHIQRTLFQRYQEQHTQVFVTSHSTHIASQCRLSQVTILVKSGQASSTVTPGGLLAEDKEALERYLDATRSTLLFAFGVMLVEGDAELFLIPRMVERVFGRTLDEMGISLISVGGTNFLPFVRLFGPAALPRRCSVISDLDTPWIEVTHQLHRDHPGLKTSQDKAHELGIGRQNDIAALHREPLVKSFFATNTFEVELLRAGNSQLLAEVYSALYRRPDKVERVSNGIAGADFQTACYTLLDVCEDKGKGWVALKTAERLDHTFKVPDYIVDAVVHAANLGRSDLTWLVQHWQSKMNVRLVEDRALNRWSDDDIAALAASRDCPQHILRMLATL